MKIVADENIPYVNDLFSPLGEVALYPGRNIRPEDIADADILLVRSVTKVNESLLKGSTIRFVGTCTIGLDHLDTRYLNKSGITFASAPGCNANAVVQYVVSALARLGLLDKNDWPFGCVRKAVVVGGGNVGSRVYRMLDGLGFDCHCVDPFLDPSDSAVAMRLASFDTVYAADLVCLHTPLTIDGPHPTHHMFGSDELKRLQQGAVLLNAGRGEVIDNNALLSILNVRNDLHAVLDVWANEPDINTQLLQQVALGTPHIAGYSFEGRVGGSLMIFDALTQFLASDSAFVAGLREEVVRSAFGDEKNIKFEGLKETVLQHYDIADDFSALKQAAPDLPSVFDRLRKNYPKRREFSHYRCSKVPAQVKARINALGFKCDE